MYMIFFQIKINKSASWNSFYPQKAGDLKKPRVVGCNTSLSNMNGFEFHQLPPDSGEEIIGPFKVLLGEMASSFCQKSQYRAKYTVEEHDLFLWLASPPPPRPLLRQLTQPWWLPPVLVPWLSSLCVAGRGFAYGSYQGCVGRTEPLPMIAKYYAGFYVNNFLL